ncbi:MAG: CRISPR-associated endonuclease Cas1 [Acidobacteriota bacterium]|jgi:CRISPR-associated protein Cas1|nr:CRISPR-associated endonuclease Cas1 [Acidobacteriota bacterium]
METTGAAESAEAVATTLVREIREGAPHETRHSDLPEYIPARMLNEFAYCPRVFFYEWVEGVFKENADIVEGLHQHRRVDRGPTPLPAPGDLADETMRSRSITMSSDRHGVIARMDLIEVGGGAATPVDYKHGEPKKTDDGLETWPSDRMQLAVQGLILRDNGYRCEEGLIYYMKTRQRVRVRFDDALMEETLQSIRAARAVAAGEAIPPPLEDSPKCPGCSLVGICLPDETVKLTAAPPPGETSRGMIQLSLWAEPPAVTPPEQPVRRLITPRDELKPVYLNTHGLRVGKSGGVLQVREKDALRKEIRIGEISQLNLLGNIQVTTQAVQALCQEDIPICYFSQGGWFYGITAGMNTKNVFLRKTQYRLADDAWFPLSVARKLVAGKIKNQRTMLQRNHVEPRTLVLRQMKRMAEKAASAASVEELLGMEGHAARLYFGEFSGMVRGDGGDKASDRFKFDFSHRNRRPPKDAVNALLSYAYSLLAKDCTVACYSVGFDPMLGFYHQPRFGRPALALDLMEPFRPLIAESVVLSAINNRMVQPCDFVSAGQAVALTAGGRKGLLHAYELRMDALVTHPEFDYRVSYRRMLEIQARLLARYLQGEIRSYPVFVTR